MKALPKRKGNVDYNGVFGECVFASMKALPKRKGNSWVKIKEPLTDCIASMKALPKRKGNLAGLLHRHQGFGGLNESPSEKEGKSGRIRAVAAGNAGLNESPSEKEGKYRVEWAAGDESGASMKALPKRKGNAARVGVQRSPDAPQ